MATRKKPVAKTSASQATSQEATPVSHEEIAHYAYRLYEERGRVPGHELEDWIAAERALTANRRSGHD